MKNIKFLITAIFIILISFFLLTSVQADTKNKIFLYFFWREGCPYCAKEKIFLKSMQEKYSSLEIKDYELSYNPASWKLFQTISNAYKISPTGVPVTFIGEHAIVGFSEKTATQIEQAIKYCLKNSCEDPLYKK